MTDSPHMLTMLSDKKMRSGLKPLFHLALLNDLESFILWINEGCTNVPTVQPLLHGYMWSCISMRCYGC